MRFAANTICYYSGTVRNGHILCDKFLTDTRITPDKDIVNCPDCLRILGTKVKQKYHIHLNYNFLKEGKLNQDNILEFSEYESNPDDKLICNIPKNKTHYVTNDPREATCSHCRSYKWGKKGNRIFILTGLLIESGLELSRLNKLSEFSTKELEKMLDVYLHGGKV
ncbi:MAG: hypothetical protein GOVbin556_6 [Prokaryotic dsDNA virus sp.]|nr:MAG: hypothetical protein GOVbin556_6 [Prokaryotic dsDNA virus sp.]|tara:strand:- start:485 stop:982 length:498 start_codon:yes stop_codon:yes gene_type:complete